MKSTTQVRRTQAERRRTAEEALLDAAARLIARKGVDATSLADIGKAAGYSRGIVNHHFGSRAELLERLALQLQRRFRAHLDPRHTGVDAIIEISDAYLAGFEPCDTWAFLVMWGSSFSMESPLREAFVNGDDWARQGVERVVRAGQVRGALAEDVDAAAFSLAFVALLRGLAAQFVIAPTAVDLEVARQTCAELVRAYFRSSAATEHTPREGTSTDFPTELLPVDGRTS